jgi:hypothetical protein
MSLFGDYRNPSKKELETALKKGKDGNYLYGGKYVKIRNYYLEELEERSDKAQSEIYEKYIAPHEDRNNQSVTDETFDDTDKTLTKSTTTGQLIEPNPLFKYATYNSIFTLSALDYTDITNAGTILSSKNPHDIIVKSGGIGLDPRTSQSATLSQTQEGILDNKTAVQALRRSKQELKDARDLYFSNVTINSIPPMNQDRRLTAVTKIEMEIIEPLGLSLLDKIRGAAANCGYLDHVDAPYLLTVQFQGFDELGRPVKSTEAEERRIPIKITNIRLNINAGSTTYNVTAVAYNEFQFMNQYNYSRSTGEIIKGETLSKTLQNFQNVMNQSIRTEEEGDEFAEEGKSDQYQITVDPEFGNDMPDPDLMTINDFYVKDVKPGRKRGGNTRASTFQKSDAIITVLTALMKTLPRFQDENSLDNFKEKIKGGTGGKEEDFYFNYFAIDGNIVMDPGRFDHVRGTHPKIIRLHIHPHKIHAYSLAEPGTSTGTRFTPLVRKEYNYIYTGENVDILDVNIDYKVAYYQTKLKDVPAAGQETASKSEVTTEERMTPLEKNAFLDPPFIHKTEPGVVKSLSGGVLKSNARLDQLFDAISNPQADMVNIEMEILGDPAWLGQVQFMPSNPSIAGPARATDNSAIDSDKLALSNNQRNIWNSRYKSFDMNNGEPIIQFNFRTPTDFDTTKGTYNLSASENIGFSGLYKVVGCVSTFADGKFTQTLNLVRTKSQGDRPYVPNTTTVLKPSNVIVGGNKITEDASKFKDNAIFTKYINAYNNKRFSKSVGPLEITVQFGKKK